MCKCFWSGKRGDFLSTEIFLIGIDVDNDSLTFEIVTTPSHGSAELNGSIVHYTPADDFNGNDSFTYIPRDDRIHD